MKMRMKHEFGPMRCKDVQSPSFSLPLLFRLVFFSKTHSRLATVAWLNLQDNNAVARWYHKLFAEKPRRVKGSTPVHIPSTFRKTSVLHVSPHFTMLSRKLGSAQQRPSFWTCKPHHKLLNLEAMEWKLCRKIYLQNLSTLELVPGCSWILMDIAVNYCRTELISWSMTRGPTAPVCPLTWEGWRLRFQKDSQFKRLVFHRSGKPLRTKGCCKALKKPNKFW